MKHILCDFIELPMRKKINLVILIVGIIFMVSKYYETYMNQDTPSSVMSIYLDLPLEDKKYVTIEANNYNKLSVFSMDIITNDPNRYYENKVKEYLLNKGYLFKDDSKYCFNKFYVIVERQDKNCKIRIAKEIVGVYR